jgi:tRNA dimethylallyltransferase
LEQEADESGLAALHIRLASVDAISAGRIHPHDRRRIIRALEVWELTGFPRSHFQVASYQDNNFRLVGLQVDREVLHRRLLQRTRGMLRAGLVEEVEGLLQRGYDANLIPLQSIGYAQVVRLLQGSLTTQEAEDEIVLRSLQFARRQMTWFKRDPRIIWLQAGEDFQPEDLAEGLLSVR